MSNMIKKITISAMLMSVGLLLPFITFNNQQLGSMFLLIHIPVFLCGIICGWQYGFLIGGLLPILRFFLFSKPILYPVGISMSFELATYGLIIGLIYAKLPKNIFCTYISLILSMVVGRIVWGISQFVLLGLKGNTFTLQLFISGAVIDAIPGIIIQLIFIPLLVVALKNAKVMK